MRTEAMLISATLPSRPKRARRVLQAPKVFVSMTSAPAAM
jgi:hypothetical protein